MDGRRLKYSYDHQTRAKMNPCFPVPLILFTLILQLCRDGSGYCPEAVQSMVKVKFCPITKQEWETAAKRKHCDKTAAQQTCSDAKKFVYHCVINGFQDETLEVCAPQKLITGRCTEFNVGGGVIQSHSHAPCNKEKFPNCTEVYYSSVAYNYQGCYEIVYSNRTSTTEKPEQEHNITIPAVLIPLAIVVCCIIAIAGILRRRHKARGRKGRGEDALKDLEEQMNLIPRTGDKDHGPPKDISTLADDKEKKPPLPKATEEATGADKFTIATFKSDEDYREENEEDSKRYLKYYQKMDKYFVETKTYKEAKKIFDTNGIVIFTGSPGCGKTMAAIHLIGEARENCIFRKIRSWEELAYIDNDKKSIVLIDNIFFRRTIDLQLENWWKQLDEIYDKYLRGCIGELGSDRLRILITARPNVIERACTYMEKVTPILNEKFVVDTSTLTEDEKDEILVKQIEFAKGMYQDPNINAEFKRKVKSLEGPIGFPLCAHLYVCGKEYRKSGLKFFSSPIEYLKLQIKDEIDSDRSHRVKSLFFCLFFHEWCTKMGNYESIQIQNETLCKRCLEKVSPNLLPNFGPFDFNELESEAESLSGAFFKLVGEHTYKFVHDSVYEAVGAYLCETYVIETLKYFPIDIIHHQDYESLTERQMSTLATRLLYETLEQQLSDVFSCKSFQNRKFADCFCSELKKKDDKTISTFFTVANKSSSVRLPCLFWSSCYNLTYLTELFFEIVTESNINPGYQMYVLLYGICCARSEGLLKKINGMLYDNFEMIKNRVVGFQDQDEKNSILHLLMTSDFSDEFLSVAVEQLLNDKLPPSSKNKRNITPLMFAVEQGVTRDKVIKILLKVTPKLTTKDENSSNLLHRCLKANNDDKTCVRYLETILNGLSIGKLSQEDVSSDTDLDIAENRLKQKIIRDLLSQEDVNGDTPLSIAANCSKHSRIRSILFLLKNDENIVKKINYDGNSLLHLSVKSLKDMNASDELECCVRVVIFIQYGANPNKKSDAEKTADQECHYDLVKTILRNPQDKKNIKKSLLTILENTKCNQCKKLSDEELMGLVDIIPPEKMNTGIRKCIAKAVQHLEHQL